MGKIVNRQRKKQKTKNEKKKINKQTKFGKQANQAQKGNENNRQPLTQRVGSGVNFIGKDFRVSSRLYPGMYIRIDSRMVSGIDS